MGFQTKVQLIKRKTTDQWYINFPAAIAQAMEFQQSEVVEWFVEDKETLVLKRKQAPDRLLKKKRPPRLLVNSEASGLKRGSSLGKIETG